MINNGLMGAEVGGGFITGGGEKRALEGSVSERYAKRSRFEEL